MKRARRRRSSGTREARLLKMYAFVRRSIRRARRGSNLRSIAATRPTVSGPSRDVEGPLQGASRRVPPQLPPRTCCRPRADLARRDSSGAAARRRRRGAGRDLAGGSPTLGELHMLAELVEDVRCACHPAALEPFLAVKFDEGALAVEARKKRSRCPAGRRPRRRMSRKSGR